MNTGNVLLGAIQELRRLGSHEHEIIAGLETLMAMTGDSGLDSDIDALYVEAMNIRSQIGPLEDIIEAIAHACAPQSRDEKSYGHIRTWGESKAYNHILGVISKYGGRKYADSNLSSRVKALFK